MKVTLGNIQCTDIYSNDSENKSDRQTPLQARKRKSDLRLLSSHRDKYTVDYNWEYSDTNSQYHDIVSINTEDNSFPETIEDYGGDSEYSTAIASYCTSKPCVSTTSLKTMEEMNHPWVLGRTSDIHSKYDPERLGYTDIDYSRAQSKLQHAQKIAFLNSAARAALRRDYVTDTSSEESCWNLR